MQGFRFINRTVVSAIAVSLLGSAQLRAEPVAENWPHWRGSADNGSVATGDYPTKFDTKAGLLWTINLPGKGCSTPIVLDHKIYLTAPVEQKDALLAYDWAGKRLWQTTFGPDREGKSHNGSGCNPSPVTDGKNLFVYFKSGELAGIDLSGKILWKTNLQERFGHDTLYWDLGTSPVLTEKYVVIAVMHNGGSYVAAFDKVSGDMAWKVARDYQTPTECDHSYATPIVYHANGKEVLLAWGAEHLTAYDPADGKLLWSVGGFNLKKHANWVCVASPVIAGDMAVVPFGRGAELHGIKLGGTGDLTDTNHIWQTRDTASFVPTPVEYKGRIYVLRDKGQVECINPVNGAIDWTADLPKKSAAYYASPTIAGGKLYAAREDGMVFVAKIEGGFELLSQNAMEEQLIASPVPVEGRILIRGESHLFCAGEK